MFIGHFALGFAAKRAAPRTSLAALIAAASFIDILWPAFVLLGLETVRIDPGNTAFTALDFVSYPWTHSLAMVIGWGVVFALAYRALGGDRRGAWILGALVVSHWVLDWISHRPDLPLAPGTAPRVGLGLWRSIPATLAVEGLLFVAGVAIYVATTRALNRKGTIGLWVFVAFLLLAYAGNVGKPPPSITAVTAAGLGVVALLIPWIWWFDRNRELRVDAARLPAVPSSG